MVYFIMLHAQLYFLFVFDFPEMVAPYLKCIFVWGSIKFLFLFLLTGVFVCCCRPLLGVCGTPRQTNLLSACSSAKCICLLLQAIVRCLWHPKTNQLAVGLGDGNVKIFYDPDKSHRLVHGCGETRLSI